ncbi:hypothetical protein M405DRAFT_742098, partial [Rhizopogon salebrosus TDB-379]
FEGHENYIWRFVFSQFNVHIVSGSAGGTMRKWNCDTGLLVGEPWKGEGGSMQVLVLLPDGTMIACGEEGRKRSVVGHGWRDDRSLWRGHNCVKSLLWSSSGGHIASGSYDGTIWIRKAESGTGGLGRDQPRARCAVLLTHLSAIGSHRAGRRRR